MLMNVKQMLAFGFLLLSAALHALAQQVYTPPGPLNFSTWVAANESWFVHPEQLQGSNYSIPLLLNKPSFGIALSGGGFRAATTGLGHLKALYLLGLVGSAKYITSNSGGSWLNAAFSFQNKVPVSTFLGQYVPPSQLSLDQMLAAAPPGSFERTIADAGILIKGAVGAVSDVVKSLAPGQQKDVGAWSSAVGQAFLQPYDLNADSSTFTAAGTAGPVHQAALSALPADRVVVYAYHPAANVTAGTTNLTRPYPIMLGAVLLQKTALGFYPFEFSPLYVGCPAFFNNTQPPIGGGFIDPLGFNTPAPQPQPTIPAPILQAFAATPASGYDRSTGTLISNTSTATSRQNSSNLMRLQPLQVSAQPSYLVPLKVVMGISSSFITNMVRPGGTITRELTGTETLQYWNQVDFSGGLLSFADGGAVDNLAVTPLLRRRITRLVVCVSASKNITNTTSAAEWGGYQWDISGLFGASPATSPGYDKNNTITGIPVELYNRKMQVFPRAGYDELYTALRAQTLAGGPTYHLASYTVLTNPYQAVFGGWKVTVLWVVSQQQTSWEAALPEDTRQTLQASRTQQPQASGVLGAITSAVDKFQEATGLGEYHWC
eukprot:gene12591-12723_t